jgi:acyl-CoA thioesterase-1
MNADRMTSGVAVIGLILATVLSVSPLTAQTKPNATQITIVALRASNTEGQGVGREVAFPVKLEALLKQKGYDVQVKDAGIKANTTGQMLERLDSSVPDGVKLVILQPGDNDLLYLGGTEKRKANIEEITKRLSARGVTTIRIDKIQDALPKQYLQSDGIHWTAEGHALIANQLLQPVMDALGAPAR